MKNLVFFLEEPSAKAFLQGILPKVIGPDINCQYVVFEGKQDLERRLPIRLKSWLDKDAKFIVMRDQDNSDCKAIKQSLRKKCIDAGKNDVLIRIACHELETFFLGDLFAVSQAFNNEKIAKNQSKSKFRNPDRLSNPSEEIKKLIPTYQKVAGARAIAPYLSQEHNCSTSFKALITGIQKVLGEI